jgi:hypothetical protein
MTDIREALIQEKPQVPISSAVIFSETISYKLYKMQNLLKILFLNL